MHCYSQISNMYSLYIVVYFHNDLCAIFEALNRSKLKKKENLSFLLSQNVTGGNTGLTTQVSHCEREHISFYSHNYPPIPFPLHMLQELQCQTNHGWVLFGSKSDLSGQG